MQNKINIIVEASVGGGKTTIAQIIANALLLTGYKNVELFDKEPVPGLPSKSRMDNTIITINSVQLNRESVVYGQMPEGCDKFSDLRNHAGVRLNVESVSNSDVVIGIDGDGHERIFKNRYGTTGYIISRNNFTAELMNLLKKAKRK